MLCKWKKNWLPFVLSQVTTVDWSLPAKSVKPFVFLFFCLGLLEEKSRAVSLKDSVPVLLVHGVFSDEMALRPLQESLSRHGLVKQAIVQHGSYFGQHGLEDVAKRIHQAALELRKEHQVSQIHIVAFSMGALATRYMIQLLGGKEFVDKFISISGPHEGTYLAYLPSFLSGMKDMQPGSRLIEDLKKDPDPFGAVQVYSFYTPYDLIVPGQSSVLKGSVAVKRFEVALHHQMIKHEDVLSEVAHTLEPELPKSFAQL